MPSNIHVFDNASHNTTLETDALAHSEQYQTMAHNHGSFGPTTGPHLNPSSASTRDGTESYQHAGTGNFVLDQLQNCPLKFKYTLSRAQDNLLQKHQYGMDDSPGVG